MKLFVAFITLFFLTIGVQAQKSKLPNIEVKSLDGKKIEAKNIQKEGKPMVISFWATWCKPCVKELNAIRDVYPDWLEEVDFQFVAISIDDSRSQHNVAPFVKSRGWEYEIYLDANSDLKRALNFDNVPHTMLYDKEGKLVWQHSGYAVGDEDVLFEQILKYSK